MFCSYCNYWMGSQIYSTKTVNKKNYSLKICSLTGKKIESGLPSCEKFSLNKIFFCDKLNCQKDVASCLYGHQYSIHGKYPKLYDQCQKCRQYEKIIKPMAAKHGIIHAKDIFSIKRRSISKDYKLPRRNKSKSLPNYKLPRRQIKNYIFPRRNKNNKIKTEIKIKRRNKKTALKRRKI